jgi:thiol-disulfide isomerase/thioredoxin
MAVTPSTMLELGTTAPYFSLPEPATGRIISLGDFDEAKALVVVFMCNHCPFVKHIASELARFAREYAAKGIATVGINANDVTTYRDDNPERMVEEVERRGYVFPYLYDELQEIALAYRAACTPDFYLFDGDRRLVYRGRFDGATPGNKVPVTGADLRAACDALLASRPIPAEQHPSMGCNIKWKAGNEPLYFKR